jgi:hypothetical protein
MRGQLFLLLAVLACALAPRELQAGRYDADVVLVVDTSTSMTQPGYDPERTSVLVAKLFADLVPGQLAVVRLLDLSADSQLLPSRDSGKKEPCNEDPSRICNMVEPVGNWEQLTRTQRHGALERPARGDAGYKRELEKHLQARIGNSIFHLSFEAARGIFDTHPSSQNRHVIWLSDGKSDQAALCPPIVAKLQQDHGARVEAVLFGKGDPSLAQSMGLPYRQTSSPAQLMNAFAGIFRTVVGAPFEQDGLVSSAPDFEIVQAADEAWVVVYSDQPDLQDAWLVDSTGKRIPTEYAQDTLQSAGAYRVAHMKSPAPGRYRVEVSGGGPNTAYAVVQRADLVPRLVEPKQALAGVETTLVAVLEGGQGGQILSAASLPAGLRVTARIDGAEVSLRDDGSGGDAAAADGRFSGRHTFPTPGGIPVVVHALSQLVDVETTAEVLVEGAFEYLGGAIHLDLGSLSEGDESCVSLIHGATQQGPIEFELREERGLPIQHELLIRSAGTELVAGGKAERLQPGSPLELCLRTGDRAPSSLAQGEHWLTLQVRGSSKSEHAVPLELSWEVDGLGWLARWLWLILLIAGIVLVIIIALGFILPKRFPAGLSIALLDEREGIEEEPASALSNFSGVGIGFYRNARAYINADYTIGGKKRGPVARLQMSSQGLLVFPEGGELEREGFDGDWEPVEAQGRRPSGGEVFRAGDSLYFLITRGS